MKKCLHIIFLFSSFLLFSCTSELLIPTILPAEVPISIDQWKVVAINRYNPELLSPGQEKVKEVMAEGSQEAFYGAMDAILDDSTYYLVHNDSATFKMSSPGDTLFAAQLRSIHQQYPFHLLLSLNNFEVSMEEEWATVEDPEGFGSTTAYYFLLVRSSWTLYDSAGTVLDKVVLMREEPYKSRPVFFGVLAIEPNFSKAASSINRLAYNTGYDYWSRLSPQPITFTRAYYSTGKFREPAAAIAIYEWETAIALLEPLAEGNKKIAAKAAYNMAVVYEAMGKIDQAKSWASAASLKGNDLAVYLLQELEKYDR